MNANSLPGTALAIRHSSNMGVTSENIEPLAPSHGNKH